MVSAIVGGLDGARARLGEVKLIPQIWQIPLFTLSTRSTMSCLHVGALSLKFAISSFNNFFRTLCYFNRLFDNRFEHSACYVSDFHLFPRLLQPTWFHLGSVEESKFTSFLASLDVSHLYFVVL